MKKIIIYITIITIILIGLYQINKEHIKNYFLYADIGNKYTEKMFVNKELEIINVDEIENIASEDKIDNITQTIYYDSIDEIHCIYSYITIDGKHYFLGSSNYNQINHKILGTPLQLTKVKLNNLSTIYKFTETFGANYARTTYIDIQNKTPKIIISIDGHTSERDIDQDSKIETIANYGTPGSQTFIYKWNFKEEKVSYIYLNDKVFNNSPSVYINDKSQIVVYLNSKEKYYILRNNKVYKYIWYTQWLY